MKKGIRKMHGCYVGVNEKLRGQAEVGGPKHIARRNVLSWQPAGLFNAMIAPLTPLGIKG
jgi:hypothetical protein